MTRITTMVWSLTQSQTSWSVESSGPQEALLRTKLVEVMELQLSYFKSYNMVLFGVKMMVLKCYTQYVSKIGKLSISHRTGKGKFSFQFQRRAMPKNVQTTALLHSFHLLASHPQNPSSQASTVPELRNSRCISWIWKSQRNQRSNCQHLLDHRKSERSPEKYLLLLH